jgi:hypothetical protein
VERGFLDMCRDGGRIKIITKLILNWISCNQIIKVLGLIMKISSLLSASAIAASTLIAFSTAALAISQPKNITANVELQSLQISEHPPLKIAATNEKGEEEADETSYRGCPAPLQWLCGWW